MSHTETARIAETVWRRFRAVVKEHNYSEILALHGLARLGFVPGHEALAEEARGELLPFVEGKVGEVHGAFELYRCGGNAAAYLFKAGKLPEAKEALREHGDGLLTKHPRSRLGLFSFPPSRHAFPGLLETPWIDEAFAVCPFLLYAGLALGREAWVDEACRHTLLLRGLLLEGRTGLFHQAVGFSAPGVRSKDQWSRGNGWAAIALAELACSLPASHPYASTLVECLVDFLEACRRTQDADGLWHQDMTDHASYVETSGSGLILYAMGRALEKQLVGSELRNAFTHGLEGYLAHIAPDGSVDHCCRGCLSPKDGSAAAYKEREWRLNDEHAFGPAILAFGQAATLGIREVRGVPRGRAHE